MNTTERRSAVAKKASKRQVRDHARRLDPRNNAADRKFMRELVREANADTTGNPVYKAIAAYDRKHYPDLLD